VFRSEHPISGRCSDVEGGRQEFIITKTHLSSFVHQYTAEYV
jgi:hypothetical protein